MIEDLVSEIFKRIGHVWKFKNGFAPPSVEDVQGVLDKAVVELYSEDVGSQFETGGLIIEKRPNNQHAVYVYTGEYQ